MSHGQVLPVQPCIEDVCIENACVKSMIDIIIYHRLYCTIEDSFDKVVDIGYDGTVFAIIFDFLSLVFPNVICTDSMNELNSRGCILLSFINPNSVIIHKATLFAAILPILPFSIIKLKSGLSCTKYICGSTIQSSLSKFDIFVILYQIYSTVYLPFFIYYFSSFLFSISNSSCCCLHICSIVLSIFLI